MPASSRRPRPRSSGGKPPELRVLVYSGDPGGAEAVAPVLAAFPIGWKPTALSKASALRVFRSHGARPVDCGGWSWPETDAFLRSHAPAALLMSASSLPWKDPTEMLLRRWARGAGVPCLAVMDNWQNYALRFRERADSRISDLPDRIAVMDTGARRDMIADGLPASLLAVTGHPGLEASGRLLRASAGARRLRPAGRVEGLRKELRICHFSQPIRDFWGDSLGYDELGVAADILGLLPGLEAGSGRKVRLTIKLHPKESLEAFRKGIGPVTRSVRILGGKSDPFPLLGDCDVALGMGTIMLVKAAMGGVPAVCYAPGPPSVENACILARRRLIPTVREKRRLGRMLAELAGGPGREAHLGRQSRFGTHAGAADRVAGLLMELAKPR